MTKKIKYIPTITFTQQAYERIKNDIIEGILKPGEKLKVAPLRAQLGIGTAPIREALSQLVPTGLVTFEDNKGFKVAIISEADIRDIYAALTFLEISLLTLSFECGDKEWEKNIQRELEKLEKIERKQDRNISEWMPQNYKFHQALLAGCGSPTLLALQASLLLKFDRYARITHTADPSVTSKNHIKEKQEHHRELVNLALKRDIKRATELMVYHINAPLEDIIKLLKNKRLI